MSGFMLPKGYEGTMVPRYSPDQAKFLNNLMKQFGGGSAGAIQHLTGMATGDPAAFVGQEAQAMNFFNKKLAPSIQQQYAHQGMLGSSAFQGAMADAGQGLAETMYNQRQDLQNQSIRDLLGLTTSLASNPMHEFGIHAKPKKEKFSWGNLFNTAIKALPLFF